jgi:large subunit ribosomal protein L18
MIKKLTSRQLRPKRKVRTRAKITGTGVRPRMSVYRSNYALQVQLIDDEAGKVLLSKSVRGKNIQSAALLGADIAKMAQKKGIAGVVFDRSGYQYHGSVKAIADAAREGGLKL